MVYAFTPNLCSLKKFATHPGWRGRLHEIIYEADTPVGKLFDVVLIILILLSILLVMLESVKPMGQRYSSIFLRLEWGITLFFTLEYVARLACIKKPLRYMFSFYGLVDLLSIIPLYLSYLVAGSQVLLTVRAFRLLRVFRVLKLVQFTGEAFKLQAALKASRTKIAIFIYVVLILSVIMGTLMYLIESEAAGFTSIPRSIYWTIVTLTTVGYGDIAPQTTLGQLLATVIMVLGYGIIAVPTGIVTVEFAKQGGKKKEYGELHRNTQACPSCATEGHRDDASHCYRCGERL